MTYPSTDNECTMLGWTEALVTIGVGEFHISHAPDADLDDSFPAFDHDLQGMMRVWGWCIDHYQVIT